MMRTRRIRCRATATPLRIALHAGFRIRETVVLEFRAEVNILNLNHPNRYPDFGPLFGKMFTSGDPRRMQFGILLDF